MTRTLEIVPLARISVSERDNILGQCAEIDHLRLSQYGVFYSDEAWDVEHFRIELPGKSSLTQIALGGPSSVQAFWVASLKVEAVHHTHRVATRPGGSPGLGWSLAEELGRRSLACGEELGCFEAQLTVHPENRRAIGIYERMGYRRLQKKKCAGTDRPGSSDGLVLMTKGLNVSPIYT